jgi:tetratricopeptide (TPR) repeat protein
MLPPTRLPSGDELRDLVVDHVVGKGGPRKLWNQLRQRVAYRCLLPELVFQRVFESVGPGFSDLLAALDGAAPNNVHQWLGIQGLAGAPLLTTNFDGLIERASGARVIHLHGIGSRPESLVVRLFQVGLNLPPAIGRLFSEALAGRTLYVMGYSGRDDDVMRELRRNPDSEVRWLVFPGDAPPVLPSVTSVPCDLRALNSAVGRMAGPAKKSRARLAVIFPSLDLDESTRYGVVSKIAVQADDLDLSLRAAMRGFETAQQSWRAAWHAANAAEAARLQGRGDECGVWVSRGLRLRFRERDDVVAALLNMRGLWLLDRAVPRAPQAQHAFERAVEVQLEWAKAEGVDRHGLQARAHLGPIFNNLGWAAATRGDLAGAEDAYRRSLAIKRETGNVIGQAQTAVNLAILFYEHEYYGRARYWRERALQLCSRFGLSAQRGELLMGLGDMACQRGRRVQGVRWLREARNELASTAYAGLLQRAEQLLRTHTLV